MRALTLLALLSVAACGLTGPPDDRTFTLATINGQALPAFGEAWTTSDGLLVFPAFYHEGTLDVGGDGVVTLRYSVSGCDTCAVSAREAIGSVDRGVLTFDAMSGSVVSGSAEVVNRNDTMGFDED